MNAKILMCRCFMEKFHQEGHDYMKKKIHFHCKHKEKHLYFVLFGKDHLFGTDYSSSIEERKCSCATDLSHEVCQFCINARYLLKFMCYKVCMNKIPASFQLEI